MSTEVLSRAREPFTAPLRTLDALHLATCAFAQQAFGTVTVATYDDRLRAGARALSVPLYDLEADPATSKA
jgi:predicted nucleic acid-binding protein